jgi:hypothetical protein
VPLVIILRVSFLLFLLFQGVPTAGLSDLLRETAMPVLGCCPNLSSCVVISLEGGMLALSEGGSSREGGASCGSCEWWISSSCAACGEASSFCAQKVIFGRGMHESRSVGSCPGRVGTSPPTPPTSRGQGEPPAFRTIDLTKKRIPSELLSGARHSPCEFFDRR